MTLFTWGCLQSIQNLRKTMYFKQNRSFTEPPQSAPPPPPTSILDPSRTFLLIVFKLLGPQTRRVFPCLGPDGSDGQACHVPGASWPSKSYQSVSRVRFWAHSSIVDPFPGNLKSSIFKRLLWLGQQNLTQLTGRRLGMPNCSKPKHIRCSGTSNRSLCWSWGSQVCQKMLRFRSSKKQIALVIP